MQRIAQQMNGSRAFTSQRPMPARAVRAVQVSAPRRTPLNVQAIRVVNVEIPNSKRIVISLQYIFGIGNTSALQILSSTGVENKKTYELNEEEINKIRDAVGEYTTEADLRRQVSQNIKRLKDINSYRGRRHIMHLGYLGVEEILLRGLPVRGQRTKTNARTRKGRAKTVAGKKKAVR